MVCDHQVYTIDIKQAQRSLNTACRQNGITSDGQQQAANG